MRTLEARVYSRAVAINAFVTASAMRVFFMGSHNAPLIVAAFVEAYEELFHQWLKNHNANPDLAIRQWQWGMVMKHESMRELKIVQRAHGDRGQVSVLGL